MAYLNTITALQKLRDGLKQTLPNMNKHIKELLVVNKTNENASSSPGTDFNSQSNMVLINDLADVKTVLRLYAQMVRFFEDFLNYYTRDFDDWNKVQQHILHLVKHLRIFCTKIDELYKNMSDSLRNTPRKMQSSLNLSGISLGPVRSNAYDVRQHQSTEETTVEYNGPADLSKCRPIITTEMENVQHVLERTITIVSSSIVSAETVFKDLVREIQSFIMAKEGIEHDKKKHYYAMKSAATEMKEIFDHHDNINLLDELGESGNDKEYDGKWSKNMFKIKVTESDLIQLVKLV